MAANVVQRTFPAAADQFIELEPGRYKIRVLSFNVTGNTGVVTVYSSRSVDSPKFVYYQDIATLTTWPEAELVLFDGIARVSVTGGDSADTADLLIYRDGPCGGCECKG